MTDQQRIARNTADIAAGWTVCAFFTLAMFTLQICDKVRKNHFKTKTGWPPGGSKCGRYFPPA
eukprot:503799-Amphidinium_carterae.1